jgi:hypothetical protein
MELVCEDDPGRAVADDDAVEVGPAEVDDLRRRVLVRARVERLPRGFRGRRRRACLGGRGRSATGATAGGENNGDERRGDGGPHCRNGSVGP